MAVYQIYQFDAVMLPLYNPQATHDAGPSASTLQASIGGVFDVYGARRRLTTALKVVVSGIYAASEGDVLLVDHLGRNIVDHLGRLMLVATPRQWLRLQVDAIRAKQGVRGTLYRRRWDQASVVQWKTARLLNVRERGEAAQRALYAEVDLEFETAMAAWRAATPSTASGALVSGGAVGIGVTAGGNAPVTDAIITITATGAISSVAIKGLHAGIDLRWVGSLAAGQTLQIDCGRQTVVSSAGNAYGGLALGSGHYGQGWLPLAEGITPLLVESNGPGSVSVAWYDQWV